MASEPRVLGYARILDDGSVDDVYLPLPDDAIVPAVAFAGREVPLIDGNEAAAREARLVASLADARALVDDGWMLLTENGQSAEWHDRRRAWIAACEEVTRG